MIECRFINRALLSLGLFLPLTLGTAQSTDGIPTQLQGKWRVRRIIPTRTITCWDQRQAESLLGTIIEYSPTVFRWKDQVVSNPRVTSKTTSATGFSDEYYGGPSDSQVDFKQLGIQSPSITIISIDHPAANVTNGGTVEIPGDTVLLQSKNRIIITVCNVYFEADRVVGTPKP
jgi:hypothetical protein